MLPTRQFTVPVLWDKKTNTIVNNESSEIIRMFNRSVPSSLLVLVPVLVRQRVPAYAS